LKTLQRSPLCSEHNSSLTLVQQRLLGIHPGVFQEEGCSRSWCIPAVAALLQEYAVEMQPKRILYGVGRPLDCHRNALEYATQNSKASAWLGFSLSLGC
jgi:hypothetical protein